MVQKVITLLTDDIDGSEATESVSFALDGSGYEIDLSDANAKGLRESLAPFIDVARRVSRQGRAFPPAARPRRIPNQGGRQKASMDPEQRRAIRGWANKNGFQLGDKGRLPQNVIEAWEAAHA